MTTARPLLKYGRLKTEGRIDVHFRCAYLIKRVLTFTSLMTHSASPNYKFSTNNFLILHAKEKRRRKSPVNKAHC